MNNLIPFKSERKHNEPSVSDSLNRDHVRKMVRACLLRDRSIDETMGQVRRVYAYAFGLEDLVNHFYASEVC